MVNLGGDRGQGLRCEDQPRRCSPPRDRAGHPVSFEYEEPPKASPKMLYTARARVEQFIGKLKRFRRVAMRCEKATRNDASFVALACVFILVKSVHTA